MLRFPGRLFIALAVALAAYFFLYRPLQLKWGATAEEYRRVLPGDEIVARPKFSATRAVAINAPAERIWPWLIQLGLKRAGWYSYDLLDNMARPSSKRIMEQFQDLKAGDLVPMSPDGKMGFRVKELQPPRRMLWWDGRGDLSWLWELQPLGAAGTRLLTRIRLDYKWTSPYILFYLVLDAGELVMMRQCLLGIKDRAEGRKAKSMLVLSLELLTWLIAFAGFVVAEIRLVRETELLQPLAAAVFSAAMTILLVLWKPSLWFAILFTAWIWSTIWWASRPKLKSNPM